MASRVLIVGFCIAAALGGCASTDASDPLTSGPLIDFSGWTSADSAAPPAADVASAPVPDAPPPALVRSEGATGWGEASVMPAGVTAGTTTIVDEDGPYLLDSGDKVRVFVYGQPNLSRIYTVDHSGKIDVPLIGEVTARGRSTRQLSASIRERLARDYVRDPEVTVDVQQNRPFFKLGEVKNAGAYPYVSGMTVEAAVAIAGGYSDRADESRARVTRKSNGLADVMEVPSDYVLKPGDTIYIKERWF